MTGMPYVVQAGTILNGMANYWDHPANGSNRMREMLEDCLDPATTFTQCRGLPPDTAANERQHIWTHWLGYTGLVNTPGVAGVSASLTTGWWAGWRGDADRILKATFARALAVALGYDHHATMATVRTKPPTRWWPVDIVWACGNPLFEGFVQWRTIANESLTRNGHVNVILATPPMTAQPPMTADMVQLVATPVGKTTTANYGEERLAGYPLNLQSNQGFLVVGQPATYMPATAAPTPTSIWQRVGTAALPTNVGAVFWTTATNGNDTLTVSPSSADGGILHLGTQP
jgi:hypothetical protein